MQLTALDKAKVEVGVQIVERWIIAALRHHKFFRLEDLNRAIRELLEGLNQRPFRKRDGSRASVFALLERCRTKVRFGVVEAINGNIKTLLRRGRGYKNLAYLLLKAQRMAVTRTEFIVLQKAA